MRLEVRMDDLEGEIWKEHPIGIRVSNMGRVWTRNKGKWYGGKDSTPYLKVNWKGKTYSVHRLICETFKDNPNNLPYVNHIDENPSNNRTDNLEWCTQKYNINYGTAQERRVANTDYKARKIDYKAIQAKRVANTDFKAKVANTDWKAKVANTDYKAIAEKRSIPILQLNKDTLEVVKEWKSATEAERECGFNQGNIIKCCKGRYKSACGFKWRYV